MIYILVPTVGPAHSSPLGREVRLAFACICTPAHTLTYALTRNGQNIVLSSNLDGSIGFQQSQGSLEYSY